MVGATFKTTNILTVFFKPLIIIPKGTKIVGAKYFLAVFFVAHSLQTTKQQIFGLFVSEML